MLMVKDFPISLILAWDTAMLFLRGGWMVTQSQLLLLLSSAETVWCFLSRCGACCCQCTLALHRKILLLLNREVEVIIALNSAQMHHQWSFKACSQRAFVSYRQFSLAVHSSLLLWKKRKLKKKGGMKNHIQKRIKANNMHMWTRSACHSGRKQLFSCRSCRTQKILILHPESKKQNELEKELDYIKIISVDRLQIIHFSKYGVKSCL